MTRYALLWLVGYCSVMPMRYSLQTNPYMGYLCKGSVGISELRLPVLLGYPINALIDFASADTQDNAQGDACE